jgi:phage tail sheath gpL-like
MSTISTAVGLDRISRVSGYNVKRGVFTTDTQNLPQIIAVFGEANMANQMGLSTAKTEVTSAEEAAELYGYGSPIHSQMRILRPSSGDGVGGIPTIVFPQITDDQATPSMREWTVSGTANANTTHYIVVNGRTSLDFRPYTFDVKIGDTASQIANKIVDAVNSVISAPCTASNDDEVITFTTKWAGLTSSEFNITILYGEPGFNSSLSAGISYSFTDSIDGAGGVDLADSLEQFGDDWYTIVTNPYGSSQLSILEQFNGLPNDINPTGRYSGLTFKPFCAYFGSTLSDKDDLINITNNVARIGQVTNVLCPAPESLGFTWEAAANMVSLVAVVYQNNPNLDVNNLSYPDMPTPISGNIGDMKDYNNRDFLVKKGCSTVMLKNGAYVVQDLVTTYHPDGEIPLQYAYPRNLNIDWNVADSYRTFERLYLQDKTLVADGQIVDVDGCIKPKEWKGLVYELFDNIAQKALINDPEFSKSSIVVQISTLNPNRFETTFKYKRTGIARIQSTTATAGFGGAGNTFNSGNV